MSRDTEAGNWDPRLVAVEILKQEPQPLSKHSDMVPHHPFKPWFFNSSLDCGKKEKVCVCGGGGEWHYLSNIVLIHLLTCLYKTAVTHNQRTKTKDKKTKNQTNLMQNSPSSGLTLKY